MDEVVAFQERRATAFKSQQGFCGLHNVVDRATGKAVAGSAWKTPEALDADLAVTSSSASRWEVAR